MLQAFGRRMLEFVKGCLEIFGHGDVAGACGVVPVNGESAEEGTSPVDEDGVQFWRAWMRWSAFSFLMYLNPKLSTMRDKIMVLVVCFQSAGLLGTGVNPKWAR